MDNDKLRKEIEIYLINYDAFLMKCAHRVRRCCNKLDFDDIKQQLILSILEATSAFDENKSTESVGAYFTQVALNSASNMIRNYWSVKNRALSEALSLDEFLREDGDGSAFSDFVLDSDFSYLNPAVYSTNLSILKRIDFEYGHLSKQEKRVIGMYLSGYSVAEIAKKLHRSQKTIYCLVSSFKRRLK